MRSRRAYRQFSTARASSSRDVHRKGISMRKQRTWREKLADSKDLPKIKRITGNMSQRWGGGRCLIPAPLDVDAVMKRVRKGKLITIDQIRQQFARGREVDCTCPITTGIFAWIAAHAADEAERAGAK